jgi:hypothetical protein
VSHGGHSTSRKLILKLDPPTTKSSGPNAKRECDGLRERRSRRKQYESTVGLGVLLGPYWRLFAMRLTGETGGPYTPKRIR